MNRQAGVAQPLLIVTIVLGVFVLGLGGFSAWAYMQYLSYKDDADVKIATAVAKAKDEQKTADEVIFTEQEKLPTRQLVGPDDLGRVTVDYPKTWSVYIDKNGSDGQYEAYLFPGAVPAVSTRTPYALRITVQDKTYESVVDDFQSDVKSGKLTAVPVTVGETAGLRLSGTFLNDVKGTMVLFKVRDKTLKVYTQAPNYQADFDNIVLPSLKFNK
jgi:hypothetical protein